MNINEGFKTELPLHAKESAAMHLSGEMLWSLYHVQQFYNNIHFADLFRCWKNLPLPHKKYLYSHLHFPQSTLHLPQVTL